MGSRNKSIWDKNRTYILGALGIFLLMNLVIYFYARIGDEPVKSTIENESKSSLSDEPKECKNSEEKIAEKIKISSESSNYQQVIVSFENLKKCYPNSIYINQLNDQYVNAKVEIDLIEKEKLALKIKEEEEKKASLYRLNKTFDDITNITWYKQKYFTHYHNLNRTSIYMGQKGDASPFLRLVMSYTGDNWIFFENAYLSYDGNTKQIDFDRYKEKKSDNSGGAVWEWIDVRFSGSSVEWLKEFANSKNAKMRLTGKYGKTRTLTSQERQGIIDVLGAYEYLSNE